ncbi:MAG: hypothetical protein Q3998_02380 [Porphyromonas sp.]|nr:hypothetical protein [Porphyromonas sp.]
MVLKDYDILLDELEERIGQLLRQNSDLSVRIHQLQIENKTLSVKCQKQNEETEDLKRRLSIAETYMEDNPASLAHLIDYRDHLRKLSGKVAECIKTINNNNP